MLDLEQSEFQKSSAFFRPMAAVMASRFTQSDGELISTLLLMTCVFILALKPKTDGSSAPAAPEPPPETEKQKAVWKYERFGFFFEYFVRFD